MAQDPTGCYDYQLKFEEHDPLRHGQRYLSPTTGKCKKLQVQSTKSKARSNVFSNLPDRYVPRRARKYLNLPTTAVERDTYRRVRVSDRTDKVLQLSTALVHTKLQKSVGWFAMWFLKWCLLCLCLILAVVSEVMSLASGKVSQNRYPRYIGRFWGQFWAARCPREYSRHNEYLQRNPGARLQLSSEVAIWSNLSLQFPTPIDGSSTICFGTFLQGRQGAQVGKEYYTRG